MPSTWSIDPKELSTNITHAARIVSRYVKSNPDSNLDLSNIPRIVHQSWKSTSIHRFPPNTLPAVETWLKFIDDPRYPPTAYFLWDDEGVEDFVHEFQPNLVTYFDALPRPVIKSDIFRILVSKWIGGVVRYISYGSYSTPSTTTCTKECSSSTPILIRRLSNTRRHGYLNPTYSHGPMR